MPSPNLIAAALSQRTTRGKIVVLGNLIPLQFRPLRVAEEYAMLDCMTGGRVIAGLAPGGGHEPYSYSYSMPLARERFWEGLDLIVQAWTQPGPTTFEGKHYSMRYVNPWPQPLQKPHPPIWIPGSNSLETMYEVAKRDFCYFLSTRGKLSGAKRSAMRFGEIVEEIGKTFHPRQMGLLFSVYVAETDEIARRESEEAVFYFTRYCLKGHQRRAGRRLTMAPGRTKSARSAGTGRITVLTDSPARGQGAAAANSVLREDHIRWPGGGHDRGRIGVWPRRGGRGHGVDVSQPGRSVGRELGVHD